MTRRPILLIANPTSGGKPGSGEPLHDDPARLEPLALAEALQARNLDVELRELAPDDDIGAMARSAADDGRDVVVAGGDGTVSGAAAALVGHEQATLGILAMGSFNNMARGFGVPDTLDAALDVVGAGETSLVDCGWVVRDDDSGGGQPFFEAAGVGVDAVGFLVVELAERRGWSRAVRGLWRGMRMRHGPMRVTIDGRSITAGSPAVTVSNGPYHGMGFALTSGADPTDGFLDVAIFAGMSRWEVLRHFLAVARRRERHEPRVELHRAQRVTIEGARRALPAHADGVSIGTTPVTLEVRPAALRLFR